MKRQLLLLAALLSMSTACYANWYLDIINAITKQVGITNDILNSELTLQQDMLHNQKRMQRVIGQMNGHITGHSGYGTYRFHDHQSYGPEAKDWLSVINMANRGQGGGELGRMISAISRDFPFNRQVYNRGISNPAAQRYYAAKAQTTVAARAASELDYNKIQQQISYQQELMHQIENTKDIKAAMDLANRIQLEGNLINLEILRQSALVNQQQAIAEQAAVMSALTNAKFLTKG
tara:strand:- start:1380 stop:2084 length:705 start_codon:yes stop_codon:yes gene_type:complete